VSVGDGEWAGRAGHAYFIWERGEGRGQPCQQNRLRLQHRGVYRGEMLGISWIWKKIGMEELKIKLDKRKQAICMYLKLMHVYIVLYALSPLHRGLFLL
jgi:hypothetical protein